MFQSFSGDYPPRPERPQRPRHVFANTYPPELVAWAKRVNHPIIREGHTPVGEHVITVLETGITYTIRPR